MVAHWIVVVIAFVEPVPVDSKLFGPHADEAKCEAARAEIIASVQAAGMETWSKCLHVKEYDAKAAPKPEPPKGVPGTEQNS